MIERLLYLRRPLTAFFTQDFNHVLIKQELKLDEQDWNELEKLLKILSALYYASKRLSTSNRIAYPHAIPLYRATLIHLHKGEFEDSLHCINAKVFK